MGSQSVIIQSGDHKGPVLVDELTRSLVSIGVSQCQLHLGLLWVTDTFDEGVPAAGTVEWLIRVSSARDAYLDFFISAGADILFELSEGPTSSADGSPLPALNRKRSSPNIASTLFFDGPTTSADGTQVSRLFVPGGSKGKAAGNALSTPVNIILTEGDHLLRVTNKASAATDIGVLAHFYEGKVP